MPNVATLADKRAVEAEMPVERRWEARAPYEQLVRTAAAHPARPALSFQLRARPGDKAVRLDWEALRAEVTRAANALRRLGIRPGDAVACVLPNGIEAPVAFLAGATAGLVAPINPLLSPEHMAALLRELGAKVVVTLAPFPRSDVAQTVAAALASAPSVETVMTVDLRPYLPRLLGFAAALGRPKVAWPARVRVLGWRRALARERAEGLDFEDAETDRPRAAFHTGGTTGLPKLTRHRARGMLYNGWCGAYYLIGPEDVLFCPLPMFHVFAVYPVFMSCLMSGAEMVMATPQGYRGEGVFENFWKLAEHWRASFLVTVPTAAARLAQVPVDADLSRLRLALCGSAAMPRELFQRFETATGTRIIEGYGLTEATCLVSANPPAGERRIGSVGLPFAYTEVSIRDPEQGAVELGPGQAGEICVRNPGVSPETYYDPAANARMLTPDGYLRTGDLGRIDAEGYVWITGRAKDLIIRGGHNIDPAVIEEALARHPAVAFVGAIGQPDAHAGEVPAAYVELVAGAAAEAAELLAFARAGIAEKAAVPRHVEILDELPKTPVGKIFKPDLRRRAIGRVFDAALAEAGSGARVIEVVEDRRLGLVAELVPGRAGPDEDLDRVSRALGGFVAPWRWREAGGGEAAD
ncbi:acyl-CoA synthetase [Amaricoccus solimangrovi]|uniref:Acyl-CoA synthetase n=1 Tax=Amaricoccus solimangrovi TaxID=2589815 RepID=A0A501WWM8_9RHOB|nr:acyl-CoA synthetase [Amaricoccus solimangrovi]TPE53132.1 acyl-CoA synthetase [Amaricoccus solimangrovi]